MNCRNKAFKGEGNPRYKKNDGWMKCKNCKKDFKVKPCSMRLGKSRTYCSEKCREEKIGKKDVTCSECGKIFKVFSCRSKVAKCCSKECLMKAGYRNDSNVNKGKGRGSGGRREDLNGMYFRSSWEANYARYLNFLIEKKEIKKWEFEVDTFEFHKIKKGTRYYTPDFKIENNDGSIEYHEVKGWMDDKSITKMKRMEKYYPSVKIKIVGKEFFNSSSKILRSLIKNWEVRVRVKK